MFYHPSVGEWLRARLLAPGGRGLPALRGAGRRTGVSEPGYRGNERVTDSGYSGARWPRWAQAPFGRVFQASTIWRIVSSRLTEMSHFG